MSNDAYIIFEADQVLTNDHLNDMFNYLDVQERLTRNKLIGIGIVCGLELKGNGTTINISKGCGVTSKGYLIVWDEAMCTQHVDYTLPANPLYKPFVKEGTGKQYKLWRLLTDEQAAATEATKTKLNATFLRDKVVVLFLEANEIDLKNCDTQDCNDKGRQMQLNVHVLLVGRSDMEEIIIKQKKLSNEDGLSDSYLERLGLPDIALKRMDVKATSMATAYDIINGYIKCMDDDTLQAIAGAYSKCYSIFKPVLDDDSNTNPFKNLEADLKAKLDYYRKSMPIYIQYYYDFLDDLVKAYHEFKETSFEVITECCPDEDLFPMHLMLGEASVNTTDHIRSPFRQYFISSPLFNRQREMLGEVKILFSRMVSLVKSLFIPLYSQRTGVPIRITPSRWSSAPLSARSIPYYYNLGYVAKTWSPYHTVRGKANAILTYNADKHSPAAPDHVLNPLMYAHEQQDFYRIEGHIGQDYSSVLNVLLSNRNSHRLPFDIIALNAGGDAAGTAVKYNCHFEDLETLFGVLKAELACKMHEPVCLAAKIPATMRITTTATNNVYNFIEVISNYHSISIKENIAARKTIVTNFVQRFNFASKGDFIKTYCTIQQGTLGNEYVNAQNKFYSRPAQIDLSTTNGAKAALMHLIDIVEALMRTITGSVTVHSFDVANFNKLYDLVVSFCTDLMQALLDAEGENRSLSPMLYGMLESVVTSCFDERFKALKDDYDKRVDQIKKRNLFSEFIKSNPGIDHKAGVPRGGTFVLVYHENPPEQSPAMVSAAGNAIATLAETSVANKTLAETSVITKSNLNQLMTLVNNKDLKLSESQSKLLQSLIQQQFGRVSIRQPFNIPENAVVADFYLPYLCCSDCPPLAYIIPERPVEIVLQMDKTEFCNNDSQTYAINASPEGGTLTASGGGLDAANKKFSPKDVTAGDYIITYKLEDGRSKTLTIKVVAAFQVDFTTEAIANDPFSIRFIPVNADNKTVLWNFGDGNTSTEPSPVHKYKSAQEEQSFTVSLTVTGGPCVASVEKTVRIKPLVKPEFSIEPQVFCANDKEQKYFKAQPAIKDVEQVENPGGLKLSVDEKGLNFSPAKQAIKQTTTFNVSYQGIKIQVKIIVPDASFTMDLVLPQVTTHVPSATLTLKSKQTDADKNDWKVVNAAGNSLTFSGKEVVFNYSQLNMEVFSQVTIVHRISYEDQTGTNCSQERNYVITPTIARKHLNQGPFDNETTD